MYGLDVAWERMFWHWWPPRAQHWFLCWSSLFFCRFFPHGPLSFETYFLMVSMWSIAGVRSGSVDCHFAASSAVEWSSSLSGILRCDRVHINLKLSCLINKVSLESISMADDDSVHLMPHRKEFCIMWSIVSKIACISAEIIEQEDGRMCCWMIYNKLQLNALPTSLVFQDSSV